jgi:hypothetical protein
MPLIGRSVCAGANVETCFGATITNRESDSPANRWADRAQVRMTEAIGERGVQWR